MDEGSYDVERAREAFQFPPCHVGTGYRTSAAKNGGRYFVLGDRREVSQIEHDPQILEKLRSSVQLLVYDEPQRLQSLYH